MAIQDCISAAAKKEYKDFEKEIAPELENKMKNYLSGFTDYLQRTAFDQEKEK